MQSIDCEQSLIFSFYINHFTFTLLKLISTPSLPTLPSPWKVVPHQLGLCPIFFTNSSVGSFTSQKNQNRERAVRRKLRFFVLIREDYRISNHLLMLQEPGRTFSSQFIINLHNFTFSFSTCGSQERRTTARGLHNLLLLCLMRHEIGIFVSS